MKVSQSHFKLIVLLLTAVALSAGVVASNAQGISAVGAQTGCSAGGTQAPMMLTFTNYLPEPVHIVWLDFDCVEQHYATLSPNASYYQPTYDGHEWEVVTSSDEQVGIIVADPAASRIDILPSASGSGSITTRGGMGCSMGGTQDATTVAFTNHLAEPVEVFWLDSGCLAVHYATLEPNGSYEQPTYDGHEWQIFTANGQFIGTFAASSASPSIDIFEPRTGDKDTSAATGEVCSSGGTQAATTVTFTNDLMEPVTVFWLDYQCNVQYYATLVSGDSYQQPTYDGHEWVVYTTQGEYVGRFEASASAPQIDIR